MLSMVSGTVGFSPNPARRADLPLRAVTGAGGDDPSEHRRAQLAADEAHAVRDRRRAAVLGRDAVADRLGRQAADEALLLRRGQRMSTATALAPKPQPPALAPAPRRRESSSTWRLIDRIGLAFAWLLGLLFCAIAASIVIYLLVQGLRYLRPSLLVTHPTVGLHREPDRRLSGPDDRHGAGRARSRWRSRCRWGSAIAVWLSEYGRPSALARVAESTVEMLAGTPSIVLALFGMLIFEAPALGFLSQTTRRGRVRSVVLRRRGDALAGRAAARGRHRARGAAVDSRPRPRGVLRGRQDEDRDHPPGAAAGRPPVGDHRLDARRRARDRRHRDHRRPARARP